MRTGPLRMAAVSIAALLAPAAAAGQVGSSFEPQTVLGGAGAFIAPGATFFRGPLHADAGLVLGWGGTRGRGGQASAAFDLPRGLRLGGGWTGTSLSEELESVSDHVLRLTLEGSRVGLAFGRRWGEAALGEPVRAGGAPPGSLDYKTVIRGTEARAWVDLGIDVGFTFRTADVVERGGGAWDRRFVVAGYEFLSSRRFEYLDASRHSDLEVDVTADLGRFRVTARAGRGFSEGAVPDRTWASGRMATPVTGNVDLVLEGGRNGGIPALGRGPSGFALVGFRVGLHREAPEERAPAESPSAFPATAEVVEEGDGPRLRLTVPSAASVEVKGDFTAWEPRSMRRDRPGHWSTPIRPGVLRFNVRVDGGPWSVPAGVPTVPDEFTDSAVAVIVVGSPPAE